MKTLLCLAAAFAFCLSAAVQERIDHGRFHDVRLYRPDGTPNAFVLLLSDVHGWDTHADALAKPLVADGALVAGIDLEQLVASLEKDDGECVYPDGDLENLSHYLQGYARLHTYFRPILMGSHDGSALAYATLAQAPHNTFAGVLSLGFCPELMLRKPLCASEGFETAARAAGATTQLLPAKRLQNPWVVLLGERDTTCDVPSTESFVEHTSNALLVSLASTGAAYELSGAAAERYLAEFRALRAQAAATAPPSLPDLPLVEVAATGSSDYFAVLLSGDGGWAGLDASVATALAGHGVPVVGWDSLRYFWTARTPDGIAADLDRVLRHYALLWGKSRALVVGYSQGADVLPFALNRLPVLSKSVVERAALLAPSRSAAFVFHLANWLGESIGEQPTLPEALRLSGPETLCIYGEDDDDSLCPLVPNERMRSERLPGGHHFDGDYELLAERLLDALPHR